MGNWIKTALGLPFVVVGGILFLISMIIMKWGLAIWFGFEKSEAMLMEFLQGFIDA